MFLPLLTVVVVLVGGWITSIIFRGNDTSTVKSSIFIDRKVSLWALVCLIFFPEFNAPKSSSMLPRELN